MSNGEVRAPSSGQTRPNRPPSSHVPQIGPLRPFAPDPVRWRMPPAAVHATPNVRNPGPRQPNPGTGSAVPSSSKSSGSSSGNSIIVSQRQKGNPILQSIRNVPWEYGDVVADYVMGASTCALFLSLKYHNLNPEYIHERLKALGKSFDLRILLVLIDVKDPHHPLKELSKMAILVEVTLIPAWSSEEAGKYLELYKIYENKPADMIQSHVEGDYMSKLTEALTTVKSVNKTDVKTLSSNFKSVHGITQASEEELALLPGFGVQKAKRLHDILHQPFVKNKRPANGDSTGEEGPLTSQSTPADSIFSF
ncbi:hypothetical protein RvY_06642 [Ramazzottius varieornatus]|uniref:DNA excision repair protein ERCC-1 n=1 Tax=Ramazzottius varieornatus TaxID=947166 RepID=A0A1D1V2N5_RAMVA|nr:hypothetical protein RvY_06642 [Ramazzottius varieornatus]